MRKILGTLLFGWLLTVGGGISNAQTLEDGLSAHNSYDYETALRILRPFAEQGNTDAQFSLGDMYEWGKGVGRDRQEAAKWYRLAAQRGNADAQVALGNLYNEGRGVLQDYREAMKWYRMAAEQGDALAQLGLGDMYDEGRGVPRDYCAPICGSTLRHQILAVLAVG